MIELNVKVHNQDGTCEVESLDGYCLRLSKKNNSILYLLENYLNKKLLDEPDLAEIRDVILTVSADISKLNQQIVFLCGDVHEGL
ncbi:hypothetical protein V1503_18880 [Bacillus sp. SCS-151]|uniref:hypothetical protein n=1 Tax=Nanhaiella sioensis TaxID=3115293 RepID=UPI00397C3807